MGLGTVQRRLRDISKIALDYVPDRKPKAFEGFPVELSGYSEATLSLAVYKKVVPSEFARDQASFMRYLGEEICPMILAENKEAYCMEFLFPATHHIDSLIVQERLLEHLVWSRANGWIKWREDEWRTALKDKISVKVPDWALEPISVIHGDPTCDNVLMTAEGRIRITDPIPPQWLKKPSIRAVDYGKLLQSFLGWEVVLRGMSPIEFAWPHFMQNYETAMRAVFWGMVAVKRVAYRNISDGITQWAVKVGGELEKLCEL